MAPQGRHIPEATVARLPLYQRVLAQLARSGSETISSDELAELTQLNASTVRKDLSFLGSFGTRGSGYDAAFLLSHIDRRLGSHADWPVVIAGLGNLGRALANAPGFSAGGLRVCALVDIDASLIGTSLRGLTIHHLDQLPALAAIDPPRLGVVATPASVAQDVAGRLVGVGVQAILNFAPQVLELPAGVLVRQVDLAIELQVLTFYLEQRRGAGALGPVAVPALPGSVEGLA